MKETIKQLSILILITVTVCVLWPTPFIYPIKLLVVFFHELSHALVTILTGGAVQEFVINRHQGGHVVSLGGNRFLTLSAGYLGSLIWGSALYLLAVRSKKDQLIVKILGFLMIGISVLFMRDLFSVLFCVGIGLVMIGISMKLPMIINDTILRVIGLTSMLYVPLDIYSDTMMRSQLRSDAFMLAEEFFGTSMMWGAFWLVLSGCIIGFTIKSGLKRA